MDVLIKPSPLSGALPAIASKSYAHRLLICAALAEEETHISCSGSSDDISATLGCIKGVGAEVRQEPDGFTVFPRKTANPLPVFDCGESGSTYRFLLPVVCALGLSAQFLLAGRLKDRPMEPLFQTLEQNGACFSQKGQPVLLSGGSLNPGIYSIPGNISSQYISGLIFALPLLKGDSVIDVTTPMESKSYIDMTLSAVRQFGVVITQKENQFLIPGNQRYRSPKRAAVEGDWSNSAFWLCAGALSEKGITCRGLNLSSAQGDKKVLEILTRFGAQVHILGEDITVKKGALRGTVIDAEDIPDLIPVLSVVAAAADGDTTIVNAGRLKYKESDRMAAIVKTLTDLGGKAKAQEDTLLIGGGGLQGGRTDGLNDHRIAMMAAIAASASRQEVLIRQAEAVKKSYPGFFDDLQKLGAVMERKDR